MATVSDILKTITDVPATSVPITFELYGGPHARTDAVTSRSRFVVTTHASTGAFSTTLRQGIYRVRWRIGTEFNSIFLGVPNSSNTYDFHQIATEEPDEITNPVVAYFNDLSELAATATDASLLFISEDLNADPGWFATSDDDTGTEGVDWVTDSGGVRIWKRRA